MRFLDLGSYFRPLIYAFSLVSLFALESFVSTYQYFNLSNLPATPANDLAKHAAAALNFFDALNDGQFIPRMQLLPSSLPDMPTFQYYASLLGYLTYLPLKLNYLPIDALWFAVFLTRVLALVSFYIIGMKLVNDRLISILSGILYIFSPYILSNFYGRVALPEALAHGIIPIFLVALVMLRQDSLKLSSALLLCFSTILLSMAHPIFLLYCFFFSSIFVFSIFDRRFNFQFLFLSLISLGLCSFQWLPGFLYGSSFNVGFVDASPFAQSFLSSYSGLIGYPRSLADLGVSPDEDKLYLTAGILTLPTLFLLVRSPTCSMKRATAVTLSVALIFSFSPFNFWHFLPRSFWAIQFPYRAFAFVALFASLGFVLCFKYFNRYIQILSVLLSLVLVIPLLLQPPYSGLLGVDQRSSQFKEIFANLDYKIKEKGEGVVAFNPSILSSDGWLVHYKTSLLDEKNSPAGLVNKDNRILRTNSISLPANKLNELYIYLRGEKKVNEIVKIWIEKFGSEGLVLDGKREVSQREFSEVYKVDPKIGQITIKCSTIIDGNEVMGCLDIILRRLEVGPNSGIEISDFGTYYLNLIGTSVFLDRDISVWVAKPSEPDQPIGPKHRVDAGKKFNIKLLLPTDPGEYIINTSEYLVPSSVDSASSDNRKLSLRLDEASISIGNGIAAIIVLAKMTEKEGYTRKFDISENDWPKNVDREVVITLPMAYNPLLRITQNGKILNYEPDLKGRVRFLSDSREVISVEYTHGFFVKVSTLISMLALGAYILLLRRAAR